VLAGAAKLPVALDRDHHGGEEEAGVGGTGKEGVAADAAEPDPSLGRVDPLEVGPEEDAPRRGAVVLHRTGEPGDGGLGAVGADDQGRSQWTGGGLDADDAATGAPEQAGCVRCGADLGSGFGRRVEEDRVERHPPQVQHRRAEDPGDAAYFDPEVVEGDQSVFDGHRGFEQPVHHTQLVKDLHARGLDPMGGGGIAGKGGAVEEADTESRAGQHGCQRGAGATRADDDHVVVLGVVRTAL